ncbi:MAG: hypothetical protein IH613_13255 [Desulfuromonadales bacterium]|nr:hypothetical protein [Desulfuromonadales bacterium]
MIKKISKEGYQIHMCDVPEEFAGFDEFIKVAECKNKNCVYQEKFLDFYDCLQCKYLILGSLSDQLIEDLLTTYVRGHEESGGWSSRALALKRLQEIKSLRQSKKE